MKKQSIFLLLIVTICVLFVTACTSKTNTLEKSGFTDFAGIEKEYLNSLSKLNWPKGTVLPTKLDEGPEPAASYQVGFGDSRASFFWQCEWEEEWLSIYNSDGSRAKIALDELSKAPNMTFMSTQKMDDNGREFFKENLEKARLGDPSGFQHDVQVNCR